jgi:pilus assembly protein TadC
MIVLLLLSAFLSGFLLIYGLIPLEWERRPSLEGLGLVGDAKKGKQKNKFLTEIRKIALFNRPLASGPLRRRIMKDLAISHVSMTPEEFFLLKECLIALTLFITFPFVPKDALVGWLCISFAFGYMIPEIWIKQKIKKIKNVIVKELPDAIDLLGLCVNAGLDFMLSLKWVVEKSQPSVMVDELNNVLQEISVGRTRREAIKDLALRYELPDLSTFARTLIQADKMGTSVTEALNILSEDMRLSRFRRGEQLALKAPLKMLVPLLLFIFPVVGILVAGPILIDFMENNPFKSYSGK